MMKRRLAPLIAAGALALAVGNGIVATRDAAAQSISGAVLADEGTAKTRKFTGVSVHAKERDRDWGTVQVTITVRTTTTRSGGKKKVRRRYTDLRGSYTYETARSNFLMSSAIPILRQEFLRAQTANIQLVSGATYTSQAFKQSLQSALLKAKKS
jgi:uncharacterized protein with FMN-binding domain